MRYVFKEGPLTIKAAKDANPQRIGEALAIVTEKDGGELTPKSVVEAARDPENPLHPHFEWDDSVAAEKFRHEQARDLIRCIRVEPENGGNGEAEPAYLSITGKGGVSYRTLQEIRSSPDLQDRLLAAAERDLEAFTVRYRVLKEICAVVETAKRIVRNKRTTKETRAA